MRVSAHARRGKRLRTIVAQSRDRATIVRNLGILRMRNAISRLHKFSDCAEHIHVGWLVATHSAEAVCSVAASQVTNACWLS